MRIIIIALIFFSFYSCISAQKESVINEKQFKKDIQKCIEIKVNNIPDTYFDLFDVYSMIEKTFIEEELLTDMSKDSYKNLFIEFESNKENKDYRKKYNKIYNILQSKNDNISWLESPSLFAAPVNCNLHIMNKYKLKDNDYYSKYYSLLNQFAEEGTINNWILNNKFLMATPEKEFSNIIFRAPIISMLFGHIAFNKK